MHLPLYNAYNTSFIGITIIIITLPSLLYLRKKKSDNFLARRSDISIFKGPFINSGIISVLYSEDASYLPKRDQALLQPSQLPVPVYAVQPRFLLTYFLCVFVISPRCNGTFMSYQSNGFGRKVLTCLLIAHLCSYFMPP